MSVEVSTEVYERLLGQTLASRYLIETRLGEGAMGAVYKAKHVKVGRAFAVKVLHPRLLEDKKQLQRFEREAELAGRLRHPNVIGVVDVGETPDGMRYMVMDFAEGPDLASLLGEAPMVPQRVINLTRQLLDGLFHAHEQGLIHRDFKPENVIVERDSHGTEVPRIVDFGIAILREGGDSSGGTGRLTTNGLVLGTPHYMAPEQAVADPIDHRIDLFALGIIVYEMLCGKLPFDGSGAEVARANLLLDPPPISERVPYLEVDPLIEAFSRRLMAKQREQRPPTAKAARELLDLITSDRSAAAAALGVPAERIARGAMATQDAQPIRHASGDSTYPPPIRAATEPPLASATPPHGSRTTPVRQQSIATQMTEPLGVPKRRAPLIAAAVVGVGILAGAAVVLIGGKDKAKADTVVAAHEPAPAPAPVQVTSPPPVPTATPLPPPPEPTPPPTETEPVAEPPVEAPVTPRKATPKATPKTTPKTAPKSAAITATVQPHTAAPKVVNAQALATQYQTVGAQLRDLQNKKGADATADLWPRYRYVNITQAMATQQSRDKASAILTKLSTDARARGL
jgi:serine/threonine-protein kinase